MKNKIYCFNNGGAPDFLEAIAIAEDGTCLAQHICSNAHWVKHDLGIGSDWKHEYYNEYYGEGNWELEYVEDPLHHEGLKVAFKLNQQQREEYERQRAN